MNGGIDLPDTARIGRVGLRVGDLDRAVDFYADVVGLTVLDGDRDEDSTRRVALGVGSDPLVLLHGAPDAPERGDREAGLFHVAFRVPTRAALGTALRRLEDRWRLTGASDHLVSEAIYARDPAGNGIEIYRDTPRDEWNTREDGGVVIDSLPLDLGALRDAADPNLNDSDAADPNAAGPGDGSRSADGTDRLPPGSDVGHVHLEVTDLDRSAAFYAGAVGLAVRDGTHDGATFLAAGDYHHHLGLNVWHGRTEPANDGLGLAWYEIVLPEPGLTALRDRLVTADVRSGSLVDEDFGPFETADPDGIRVRFSPERRTTTDRPKDDGNTEGPETDAGTGARPDAGTGARPDAGTGARPDAEVDGR